MKSFGRAGGTRRISVTCVRLPIALSITPLSRVDLAFDVALRGGYFAVRSGRCADFLGGARGTCFLRRVFHFPIHTSLVFFAHCDHRFVVFVQFLPR